MPFSHSAFLALTEEQQRTLAWQEGTFLAERRQGRQVVELYHLGEFFCEVHYGNETGGVLHTVSFTAAHLLDHYVPLISLDDLSLPRR